MTDKTDKKRKLDDVMAQLRVTYLQDLPHRVSGLEDLVLQLERGDNFSDVYEKLFREVHSLKGSGGTYGLPIITTICHQMEDVLKDAGDNNIALSSDVSDKLLRYIDLLRRIPENIQSGDSGLPAIEADLHSLQDRDLEGNRRCLLVEGSKTSSEMVSLVLSGEKLEFSYATNGYEALDRLLQEKFDLLITGMAIGSLNGMALIAATRLSDSVNAKMPIILLTTSETSPDSPMLMADRVISKGAGMTQSLAEACCKLLSTAERP